MDALQANRSLTIREKGRPFYSKYYGKTIWRNAIVMPFPQLMQVLPLAIYWVHLERGDLSLLECQVRLLEGVFFLDRCVGFTGPVFLFPGLFPSTLLR